MYRVCAETEHLTAKGREMIRAACGECGCDLTFFHSAKDADDRVRAGEILYCSSPALLPEMKALRWCHTASAGVGTFVESGVFDSGEILLTNSSGAYGRAISEHVVMVALMLLRNYMSYRKIIDSRQWQRHLPIRSIAGSRIAVVGTGDIGRSVAVRFRALGAGSIIGFNRSGRAAEHFDRTFRMEAFTAQIGDADIVVVCVPGTPETERLLSAERIAAIPATAYLINVGRGSSIDQDALIRALNEGRIAGAALDVVVPEPLPPDHPLWNTRNLLLTPHCSGDYGLPYTSDRTVEIFCENLRRYVAGEELFNRIDSVKGY